MKQDHCARYEEGLARLATGEIDEPARDHVAVCPRCFQRLAQLEQAARLLSFGLAPAPEAWSASAKAIFPTETEFVVARLLPGIAGARAASTSEEFQLAFEFGGEVLRLAYSKTEGRWQVRGRARAGDAIEDDSGHPILVDEEGGFSFAARSLESTGITLRRGDLTVAIPPASSRDS